MEAFDPYTRNPVNIEYRLLSYLRISQKELEGLPGRLAVFTRGETLVLEATEVPIGYNNVNLWPKGTQIHWYEPGADERFKTMLKGDEVQLERLDFDWLITEGHQFYAVSLYPRSEMALRAQIHDAHLTPRLAEVRYGNPEKSPNLTHLPPLSLEK